MGRIIQQGFFVMRFRYLPKISGAVRKIWFSLQGMKIGAATHLPRLFVTWPHQVAIGANCILEELISFKFDGIRKPGPSIRISDHVFIGSGCEFNIRLGIDIGADSLIASGCRFIDHDHGIEPGVPMRSQHGPEKPIRLGKDVWLGCNVFQKVYK